jgi:taspase (threonine aspartase 1)
MYLGYGSNLTLDGQVECDASIMDARTGNFGSVGAIAGMPRQLLSPSIFLTLFTGVKNPIRLARAILDHAQRPDELGRMPPLFVSIAV